MNKINTYYLNLEFYRFISVKNICKYLPNICVNIVILILNVYFTYKQLIIKQ